MSEREVFLSVAEAYDRWAPLYDSYDNPMVFAAGRAVDALAPEAMGRRVVEFGCGTGRNLVRLKRAGASDLVGLDLSEGMLAKARGRDPALRLIRHDMSQPAPLPDALTDLVLFCLALEHVAEIGPPLAEARRLLAPGGSAAVIEIHPSLSADGLAAHFREGARTVTMPTTAHSNEDWLKAFEEAGLEATGRREWRPRDLGEGLPPKLLKRGPDAPMLVEFRLQAA